MKKIYASIILLSVIQIKGSDNSAKILMQHDSLSTKIVNSIKIAGYAVVGGCAGAGIPSLAIALKCTKDSINGYIQLPRINPDVVVGCGVIGALAGGVFKHRKIKAQKTMLENMLLRQNEQTALLTTQSEQLTQQTQELEKQSALLKEQDEKLEKIENSVKKLNRVTGALLLSSLKTQNQTLIGQIHLVPDEAFKEKSRTIVKENEPFIDLLSKHNFLNSEQIEFALSLD